MPMPLRRFAATATVLALLLGGLVAWRLGTAPPTSDPATPVQPRPARTRPAPPPEPHPARPAVVRPRPPRPLPAAAPAAAREPEDAGPADAPLLEDPLPAPDLDPSERALPTRERLMAGDAHFEEGAWAAAYPYYLSAVEEGPDSPLAGFALYKLAWVEWNLGHPEIAFQDLVLAAAWLSAHDDPQSAFLASGAEDDIAKLLREHPDLERLLTR